MIREKKTISGRLCEVDFYPIFENGRAMPTRAPKTKRSTAAQEKYNKNQAIKEFVRLVNANFETGDSWVHITYNTDNAPQDEEITKKDINNFLRRIKRARAKELKRVNALLLLAPEDERLIEKKRKLEQPFLYAYPLEEQIYKTGKNKGKSNWHAHIFMTGGLDRDTIEDLWTFGRVNADRFQPEKFGPEAAALYCMKDPRGVKRFYSSRGMKKPIVEKPKDGRITPRGVEKLARERVDDKEYWEKRYKGYKFIRCYARYNEYNGHWYVSAILYKAETDAEIPPWSMDDWMEDW